MNFNPIPFMIAYFHSIKHINRHAITSHSFIVSDVYLRTNATNKGRTLIYVPNTALYQLTVCVSVCKHTTTIFIVESETSNNIKHFIIIIIIDTAIRETIF